MNNPWKNDFPLFHQGSEAQGLVYLDNAATTQKPQQVLDVMRDFYQDHYATVHRGAYKLAEQATFTYEQSRSTVAQFIHAPDPKTCIFVRGTTEAINLVAYGLSSQLSAGDTILVGEAEHHSNLVPWQLLAQRTGASLEPIPVLPTGDYDLKAFKAALNTKVKIIALGHVSNVTGAIHPIKAMIAIAHQYQIPVLIDGAQAVAHVNVDVQDLDCDYYAFSGHKMLGPTGIGVLYGKRAALERLGVFQGGGEMIVSVSFDESTYAPLPGRFEAGTPAIAEAIGLAEAIRYLKHCDLTAIATHEQWLMAKLLKGLKEYPFIHLVGNPLERSAICSFTIEGLHPHDIATYLDSHQIAVRAGHHCAAPLMAKWGLTGTTRVSLGLYNTEEDIEHLLVALEGIKSFFKL